MTPEAAFTFEVEDEYTQDDLLCLVITMADGRVLQFLAQIELVGRAVILRQVALYGLNVRRGELGSARIRAMVQAAMEHFDVDSIRVEETRRSSSPIYSRAVRSLKFRRRGR